MRSALSNEYPDIRKNFAHNAWDEKSRFDFPPPSPKQEPEKEQEPDPKEFARDPYNQPTPDAKPCPQCSYYLCMCKEPIKKIKMDDEQKDEPDLQQEPEIADDPESNVIDAIQEAITEAVFTPLQALFGMASGTQKSDVTFDVQVPANLAIAYPAAMISAAEAMAAPQSAAATASFDASGNAPSAGFSGGPAGIAGGPAGGASSGGASAGGGLGGGAAGGPS